MVDRANWYYPVDDRCKDADNKQHCGECIYQIASPHSDSVKDHHRYLKQKTAKLGRCMGGYVGIMFMCTKEDMLIHDHGVDQEF
jgi:hypothetical protein